MNTYLLTAWSRVLLEKLTGFAANEEIPRILWNNPKVHYRTHKRIYKGEFQSFFFERFIAKKVMHSLFDYKLHTCYKIVHPDQFE